MKIGFIGDIVGKPGRVMLQTHLKKIRQEHGLDCVIANGENASHGFGIGIEHAKELLSYGVDVISGGNHSWDKKEIIPLLDILPIVRPINYPEGVAGSGAKILTIGNERVGIVNILGHYGMPMVENPFLHAQKAIKRLKEEEIKTIVIDFHAEATSEKYAMFHLLKSQISAILGTHTHVGTDDLQIDQGTCFVSDVGLTGCRDGVIGMDKTAPLKRFLTGLPASLEIPKTCKKIFQMIVLEVEEGVCKDAFKIRILEEQSALITGAIHEQ